MQLARHLVKGFCKQTKLIRQAGIQRRRVELPVFNTLTGGNQLIQRGNHLMAYAAQSKKDQRENTDAASQGDRHHQQHFAFGVVL